MPSIEEQAESGILKAVQSQSFTDKIMAAVSAVFKKQEPKAEVDPAKAEIDLLRAELAELRKSIKPAASSVPEPTAEEKAAKLEADAKAKAAKDKAEAEEKEITSRANAKAKTILANAGHAAVTEEKSGGALSKEDLWTEYGQMTNGAEKRAFYLKHKETLNS